MKEFIFLFCCILVYSTHSKLVNRIRPYNIKCFPSDEFAPNVSCSLKAIDRKTTVINGEVHLIKPITDLLARFELLKKYNRFEPFLINFVEHLCTIFSTKSNAILSKISKEMFLRYTNLNHSCPLEGTLIVRNFQYIEGSFQSILPKGLYLFNLTYSEKSEKNFVFNAQIYAEVTEESIRE